MDVNLTGTAGNNGVNGTTPGKAGTAGGAGGAVTATNTGNGVDPQNSSEATGGQGGYGGYGGSGTGTGGAAGAGGAGGAGGAATATATTGTYTTQGYPQGNATAIGGAGGNAGKPGNAGISTAGAGASGGVGGAATATATVTESLNNEFGVSANAVATGGAGGTGDGVGKTGGAGGAAKIVSSTSSGYGAGAYAKQTGGAGGNGLYGASGGAGASSTLTNVVKVTEGGGDPRLSQLAIGGAGGSGGIAGVGGAAGAASSSLTFTDPTAIINASASFAYSGAVGGAGGSGTTAAAGGSATAALAVAGTITATFLVGNTSNFDGAATGGDGGDGYGSASGGAGGAATVTSVAADFTSPANYTPITANGSATGGAGGAGIGAGKTGGAGGNATVTSVSATGYSVAVSADATGGSGGSGKGGANGGSGGTAILTNAVKGTTAGGTMTLSQASVGGAGGSASSSGVGGAGGAASSSLTFNDITANTVQASSLNGSSNATGGAGGQGTISGKGGAAAASIAVTGTGSIDATSAANGGSGSNDSPGASAAVGGSATASASGTSTTTGTASVEAEALATGGTGSGEIFTNNAVFGAGGAGGAGTGVTATATASTATGGVSYALARQFGGNGGYAAGTGYTGGAGGTVSNTSAMATGYSAKAVVVQQGGSGGRGYSSSTGDAAGGAGASSTLTNAVTGTSDGGYLTLSQQAIGGNGGYSSITNGAGGAATSNLTFNDLTSNKIDSDSLTGTSTADGGSAGTGSGIGATAGAANASAVLTGANTVAATATARGGAAGSDASDSVTGNGSAGGAAMVTAATATTSSATLGATASGAAYGGTGGSGYGSGKSGGAGGLATVTSVSAMGYSASASATQAGGAGGAGNGGAAGGSGAASTLTNVVKGNAKGETLTLKQTADGGAGGSGGSSGIGGIGGAASSSLTFNDVTANGVPASSLNGSSNATGGAGGQGKTSGKGGAASAGIALTGAGSVDATSTANGGSGSTNSPGLSAAVGGTATASASGTNTTTGTASVEAQALATGGTGSGEVFNNNAVFGAGGAGGAGTGVTATATASIATGGVSYALARQYGGNGGYAAGTGYTGGAGGTVSNTSATATGYSAKAVVVQQGGSGGRGYNSSSGDAAGGAGASSTLTNAVTGTSDGGYLTLSQQAIGGNGGYSSITNGAGGAATSNLTFNDVTANKVHSSSLTGTSTADGGSAGTGSEAGATAGAATASIALTGANTVAATAMARGGAAGSNANDTVTGNGVAGGAATVTAATATTTSTTLGATAIGSAYGGTGGSGYGAGNSGGAGGLATVTLVSATGYSATASATQTGGAGGAGNGGATGGAGSASTLTNAVKGNAKGGTLTQNQTADGGAGGSAGSSGTGGAGGAATSSLTFNDVTANTTHASSLVGTSTANGGMGGEGITAGIGGAALANISLTGAAGVTATSSANGGSGTVQQINGGTSPAAGGSATGSAVATSTGSGAPTVNAEATATGGQGSDAANDTYYYYSESAVGAGGVGGVGTGVTATATAAAATGGLSYALARQYGGIGGTALGYGATGGIGGFATNTSAMATGYSAKAVAVQVGGSGGNGYLDQAGAAAGGAGAASTLTNAVKGITTGGTLTLEQTAEGGLGGYAGSNGYNTGGDGGAGGAANSSLSFNDVTANKAHAASLVGTSMANGGSGGWGTTAGGGGAASASIALTGAANVSATSTADGGSGGAAPRINADINPAAGGTATASADAVSTSTGAPTVDAEATASGGQGSDGAPTNYNTYYLYTVGSGGAGGVGIGAAAIATAAAATAGVSYAQARQYGGNGGNAVGSAVGGNGGAVSSTSAMATGYSAKAVVIQEGGAGGIGYQDQTGWAAGGAGAASMLTNAVSGSSGGGYLTLAQTAIGGAGGSSGSGNGSGGSAYSYLTFNDATANKVQAGTLTGSSTADAGSSGQGTGVSGTGGIAAASISLTGAHTVNASATAKAGSGSDDGDFAGSGISGGAATVSSISAVSTGGSAYAAGAAYGGTGSAVQVNGYTGGAGGTASVGTVTANGFSASASATQVGGSGGSVVNNAIGALGGAGASSTLTNAVAGSSKGGTLSLSQTAIGGSGGVVTFSGAGGAGGNATSNLAFNDVTSNTTQAIDLIGSSSADAGNGGTGTTAGTAGNGIATIALAGAHSVDATSNADGGSVAGDPGFFYYGAYVTQTAASGGTASDSASATSTSSGVVSVKAEATAIGGGGSDYDRYSEDGYGYHVSYGFGGAGGAGTGASAAASAKTATGGLSYALARQYGGSGGSGGDGSNSSGFSGGDGGSVSNTTAVATGYSAKAVVIQEGGSGGFGSSGASAGYGASSTLTNAVTGSSNGGYLTLLQTAIGGNGGYSSIGDGTGGSASSSLTFNDNTANKVQATTLTATSTADAGAGGDQINNNNYSYYQNTGTAGIAVAAINLTGAHIVNATANATGGLSDIEDGNATATATATETGQVGSATAYASASAAIYGYYYATSYGTATASATANAVNGNLADAVANASGNPDSVQTSAATTGTGVVTKVAATTNTQSGFADGAESAVDISGAFNFTGENNFAYATGLPSANLVQSDFSNNSAVAAVLGTSTANVLAAGWQGSNEGYAGSQVYTTSTSFTLNATKLSGNLIAGFTGYTVGDNGFSSATLTVSVAGKMVVTQNFSSVTDAENYFADTTVNLGAVSKVVGLVVTFSLSLTETSAGDGFGEEFLLGSSAGNGPPSIAAPVSAPLLEEHSSTISGISLSETGSTTNETFTVTLADSSGLLSATGSGIAGNDTTKLTITGSLAQVNADLATLGDAENAYTADLLTISASDSLGGKATSAVTTLVVTGAPVVAAPSSVAITFGKPNAISGVSITETGYVTGETFTVTVIDNTGTLAASGVGVSGSDSTELVIEGSLAQINADLATLTDTEFSRTATISLSATDSFGNVSALDNISLSAGLIPVITAPSSENFALGKASTLAGVSLSETGNKSGETFTVKVMDSDGTLSATGAGVTGAGSETLTINGSLTQVNADLATITYNGANAAPDTITFAASDSYGNIGVPASVAVTVYGQPIISAPATVGFTPGETAAVGGLTLSETDTAPNESFIVKVSDKTGLLAATGTGITGSGTTTLTITGTLNQVNADLATLTDIESSAKTDTLILNATDSFGQIAAQTTTALTLASSFTVGAAASIPTNDAVDIINAGNANFVNVSNAESLGEYVDANTLTFGSSLGNSGTITFAGTGSSLSSGVLDGSVTNSGTAPYLSGTQPDAANYFGAQPGGAVTISFNTTQTYFGLLWGTPDSYNTLTFYNGSTAVYALTGDEIAAAAGIGTGENEPGGSPYVNVYVPVGYTSVVATSTSPTFEIAEVAYSTNTTLQAGTATTFAVSGLLTLSTPAAATVGGGKGNTISGVSLSQAGTIAGEIFTVTLADTNGLLSATGSGVTGAGTPNLTITGSLAQVNADLATLTDADAVKTADAITVNATDSLGDNAAAATIAVAVASGLTPVLTAPSVITVGAGKTATISGVGLAETGSTSGETFTVTVSDIHGKLSASGSGVTGAGTNAITISGALAQVNADLATLTDIDSTTPADTISLAAVDSLGNAGNAAAIAVTVNSTPSITAPGSATLGVGKSAAITGVSLSETGNTAGETFTVKLNDTNGLLTATGTGITGAGTKGLTLTGSLAQVNADLATVTDTDASNPSDMIVLTASDSFGNASPTATTSVTVNGLPTLAVPATATIGVGKATAINGISVSESGNTTGETFTVKLSDTNGLLSATGTGITGSGTKALTLTGTLAQVNADLATLADTDAATPSDTILFTATDSFGNVAATASTAITVNGPPVVSAPATATLGISLTGALTGLSVSETGNTSGENFTVKLSDISGLLSATGSGVTGSATTGLTITGSLSQVDASLATLTDSEKSAASDSIVVTAKDGFGNVAQSKTIAVSAHGVPEISSPAEVTVNQNFAGSIAGITLSETGSISSGTFRVTLTDDAGLLSAVGAGVAGDGTTTMTITGSLAAINTALATLSDTDSSSSTDVITINAADPSGNAATPQLVTVAVTPDRPELIVTGVVAPSNAIAGQEVPVTWTLTNTGDAPAIGPWSDEVFIASDSNGDNPIALGTFAFNGTLAVGGTLTFTEAVGLPEAIPGTEWIGVRADALDQIAENVGDSTKQTIDTIYTTIAPAPAPELEVTSITPPTSAFSGQQTEVSWVVSNLGNASTSSGYWTDNIYLSVDRSFDPTDILLASVPDLSYLAAGASYQNSAIVTLPQGIAGPYYIIVQTNVGYQLSYSTDASSAFPVVLSPAPDLQIAKIITPSQEFSGQPVTLTWTVTNTGNGTTDLSEWSDGVYLSEDGTLDSSSVKLASVSHNGALAPGQSYTSSATVDLPIGQSGNFSFFVVADDGSQVYELGGPTLHDYSVPVQVNLTPPPDLDVALGSIPTGTVTGYDVAVTYTVANDGSSVTPNASWTDSVYISSAQTLNGSAITLGSFVHEGALDVGQSYSETLNVELPTDLAGQYYIIVQTDSGDSVFELDKSNNTAASTAPLTVDFPPVDLTVPSATIPTTGTAGNQLPISWEVKNVGLGDTPNENWTDEAILSASGVLGAQDNIVLGTFANLGQLSGGGSYTDYANLDLPTTLSGTYTLFIETNVGDTLPESNTANDSSAGQKIVITPLPELQVSSVLGPIADNAGDRVTVDWTVTNEGASATHAGSWLDYVYLSTTPYLTESALYLGSVGQNGDLNPGASYTSNGTFVLPTYLATDNYYFVVQTATDNQVLQVNDSGDSAASSADLVSQLPTVTTPVVPGAPVVIPPSDVAVSDVSAASVVVSGQQLTVSWTLTDADNATGPVWYDEVYLSVNQVLGADSDVALGYFEHTTSLAAGASQTFTASFSVPVGLSGPYYVFVNADAGDSLNDPNRNNNIAYSPVIQVNLPTLVSLSVASVSIGQANTPYVTINGQTVPSSDAATVTYTVDNTTSATSQGTWKDAIYLSSTGVWNIDDPILGYVDQTGIGANGSYTGTLTAVLPGLTDGKYYAIVKTDILDNQPNSNEANNSGVSKSTINADVLTLTLGSAMAGTLSAGGVAYYQFTVGTGQTVDLSMTSNAAGAANDIYVSYEAIPTIGQFDATSTVPVTQNPNAVIQESQAGTYYVMVRESAGGAENYTLTASTVNYSITGLSLTNGSNLGNVTVTIDGAQFNAGEQVELVASNGTVRAASKVYYVNNGELWATFDLQGLSVGSYSVKLQDATHSATLANGFTVTNGRPGQLSTSLAAPANITLRYTAQGNVVGSPFGVITVDYFNTGNTDIPAPVFDLNAINADFLSDEPGYVGPSAITVLGTNQTGPAGILAPGAEDTVSYKFVGVNYGTYFSNSELIQFTLGLSRIRMHCWTGVRWNSQLNRLGSIIRIGT